MSKEGVSMLQNLIAKAALRVSPVVIAGETIYVKEPTYGQITAWRESIANDKEDANAALFAACVVDVDGNPVLSLDQAYVIARGSQRVWNPLIGAITKALTDEEAKND